MFTINTGLTYLAVLLLIAGGLLILQRTTKWKIFDLVPPLVWIYVLNMILCTMGIFETDAVKATYSGFKNNLLYAMIFVMLLRCDFRKLGKLGPRMIAIFLGCSLTLAIGTFAAYPLFMNSMGGAKDTWAAVAALYASWVGGSGNMAAMAAAFESSLNEGAYGAALALDTVCYSVWIALLLLGVKLAPKWNKVCNADTSKLDAVAEAANKEVAREKKHATAADWIFLFGLSLAVSALTQWLGGVINGGLVAVGLDMFGSGTVTTVLVTVLVQIQSKHQGSFLLVVRMGEEADRAASQIIGGIRIQKLKSKTVSSNGIEATYEVRLDKPDAILNKLRSVQGVYDATLVSYSGEVA